MNKAIKIILIVINLVKMLYYIIKNKIDFYCNIEDNVNRRKSSNSIQNKRIYK